MKMKLRRQALFLAMIVSGLHLSVRAESDLSSQMVEVLQSAKVLKQPYVRATLVDKQAIILTERLPKATDRDCKIDAILIAKTIVGAFPHDVNRVRVIFNKTGSPASSQVDVSIGDVRSFENKLTDADQLLDSLDLKEVSADGSVAGQSAARVAPGPFLDRRLILLGKIEGLKTKGTGVKAFQDLFRKIEDEVPSNDQSKIAADIEFLGDKLAEQEELVKQAGHVGKGTSGNASPNSAATAAASTVSPAPAPGGDVNDIRAKCDQWDSKLAQWEHEGRDVLQLKATIALVRSWMLDPAKHQLAKSTLGALDMVLLNPPPINH